MKTNYTIQSVLAWQFIMNFAALMAVGSALGELKVAQAMSPVMVSAIVAEAMLPVEVSGWTEEDFR